MTDGEWRGSGWIADPRGVVVTAAHVLPRGTTSVHVVFQDQTVAEAQVGAACHDADALLLDLPEREGGYPSIPLADDEPRSGDEVRLGATWFSHAGWVFRGRVLDRAPAYHYRTDLGDYVRSRQVFVPVVGGTSGGVWVDASGRAVGVHASAFRTDEGHPVVAGFVPIGEVRALLHDGPRLPRASLCAEFRAPWNPPKERPRYPGATTGVRIVAVPPGSPLDEAGFRADDILTAIDGRRLLRVEDLVRYVRALPLSATVELTGRSPADASERTARARLRPFGTVFAADADAGKPAPAVRWEVRVPGAGTAEERRTALGESLRVEASDRARRALVVRAGEGDAVVATIDCATSADFRVVAAPPNEPGVVRVRLRAADGSIAVTISSAMPRTDPGVPLPLPDPRGGVFEIDWTTGEEPK